MLLAEQVAEDGVPLADTQVFAILDSLKRLVTNMGGATCFERYLVTDGLYEGAGGRMLHECCFLHVNLKIMLIYLNFSPHMYGEVFIVVLVRKSTFADAIIKSHVSINIYQPITNYQL